MPVAVLVHGAFHGGWCWRKVVSGLRGRGWEVWAPSLPGAGERGHLLRRDLSLADRVRDVASLIVTQQLADVVLCGHSLGGMVVTGVADLLPDRIARLVAIDATIPESGESAMDVMAASPEIPALLRELAGNDGDGWRISPPAAFDAAAFGVPAGPDRAWADSLLGDESLPVFEEPLAVGTGLDSVVRKSFVRTNFPVAWPDAVAARLSSSWDVLRWPHAGHDAMIAAADDVVRHLTE
ncbi:alpha/beta fold hydrolase [Amycolatopsis sp. Poz14]|uniref:alpha/beta fold hydrolase n=1 Tax=Amycolatopsis sp. Poz14 TaxID=1447705 RepID=UPI001EE8120F|nr:alpha/beta hydrolase [Amycolatopsis sp. Poz14]MCG3754007.1 alpha/beta fold hydrolase [Amycolatopsis sp. Poz14]